MKVAQTNLAHSSDKPLSPVSRREAFIFWLKLGFISFGGPAGQIAVLHEELVERRRWISETRFLHALNYCMVLPGPEAMQLATYLGWLMHRSWGGIVAGTLFFLPSLLILILLAWIYMAYGHLPAVIGVLYGVKPAVTAIVAFAAYRIGTRALKNGAMWMLAVASFIGVLVFRLPFPLIVLIAALVGAVLGQYAPQWLAADEGRPSDHSYHGGPALIHEATPVPEHAAYGGSRLFWKILIGLLLWAGMLGILWDQWGGSGLLTQMGWFFTKAALLTFGGAYAVLPYVYQAAVEHFHWLTPAQMIDGLALGETTPGPLIMVVVFVGFVAGWSGQVLGPEHLFLSGAIAAGVVTYFTFLPSFLFILVGAPLIESTHGNLKFTAPLKAVTAAVVGVILNLAVFFGYHTLWPEGLQGGLDIVAIALMGAALIALFRFKVGVILVIFMSGLIGLLSRFVG
jgi:chromate transporter